MISLQVHQTHSKSFLLRSLTFVICCKGSLRDNKWCVLLVLIYIAHFSLQVNILSRNGSIFSQVRWDEQIVNCWNLFSNVKSCGTHLLNFHLSPMWCICNIIVSSLTWNVKSSSWHVRLESDSTTFLNSSLLNETGLPDLGASSRFSSPEPNFWN